MTAKEADLEVLQEVMDYCLAKEAGANNKFSKAYLRVYKRLQAVYLRTDAALNKVAGNA